MQIKNSKHLENTNKNDKQSYILLKLETFVLSIHSFQIEWVCKEHMAFGFPFPQIN